MPTQLESRDTANGPLSMVRELPPGPAEQCTTEVLTNFVANISLFTRGRAPQEQDRLRTRMREAMDVLNARGISFVEMAHWNFGHDSRRNAIPPNDTRYDPDWYKRNPLRRGLLARLREVFLRRP